MFFFFLVSAFYFECPEKQMCMNASIYTKSRFYGMSIGVNLIGKGIGRTINAIFLGCHLLLLFVRQKHSPSSVSVFLVSLRLLEHGEEYVFGMPSAYARSILTVPWAEMGDKISITCAKTGFSSAITFHTKVSSQCRHLLCC